MQSAHDSETRAAAAPQHAEGSFSLMCFGGCPTVAFGSGLHMSALSDPAWERCHHVVSYRTGADGRLLIVAGARGTNCNAGVQTGTQGRQHVGHPCIRAGCSASFNRFHRPESTQGMRPFTEARRVGPLSRRSIPALPLQREEHQERTGRNVCPAHAHATRRRFGR